MTVWRAGRVQSCVRPVRAVIHASYVRSHFNSIEVGVQDAPRPDEILFTLVMGTGGRLHSRLGGLLKENVSVHDGQR